MLCCTGLMHFTCATHRLNGTSGWLELIEICTAALSQALALNQLKTKSAQHSTHIQPHKCEKTNNMKRR